jgi:hypothetical protein
MLTRRKELFHTAAIFAIAMVVGAWTTSARGDVRSPNFVAVSL